MNDKEQFIADLYPAAAKVSQETGMSKELILAQAALETGWGEKVLPAPTIFSTSRHRRTGTGQPRPSLFQSSNTAKE